MKFKMRAVGTFKKIPGMNKISGYKGVLKMKPQILMSSGHAKHVIDRMSTIQDWKDTREMVLAESPKSNDDLIKE